MRIFKSSAKDENKPVADLIEEERQKEAVEVYRKGWCVSQATYVLEDCRDASTIIRMAEEIYKYVYGER